MSRLIDADDMISAVENHYNNLTNDNVPQSIPDFYCEIEKLIDEQPTAYDAEKVVEGLEARKSLLTHNGLIVSVPVVILESAIEIVRRGGV